MNSFIKKYFDKIFLIFLFLQPVIDVITGLFINVFEINLTIGIIVRSLFLIFIIYYSFFVDKIDIKKKILVLSITAVYSLLYLFNIIYFKDVNVLFVELQFLFRILYFPIMLYFIPKIKVENKHLVRIMLIYSVLIIIPTVIGLNLNAYTQGKVGTSGWFNSANEISAILSILLPILAVYILNKDIKNKVYLICLVPLFMIGSKITIIALCVTIFFLFTNQIRKTKITKKIVVLISLIIVLTTVIAFVIVPKTSFYKNIVIHTEFLGINEVSDLFSYDSLNRFIFSDRLTYLENTNNNYMESGIYQKLFGIGYIENYGTEYENTKLIEMDIFDIFYRIGVIGFMLYAYLIITILSKVNKKCNVEYKISLFMIILLSCLVGHTLTAPAVAIYIVVIINNTYYNNTKRLK